MNILMEILRQIIISTSNAMSSAWKLCMHIPLITNLLPIIIKNERGGGDNRNDNALEEIQQERPVKQSGNFRPSLTEAWNLL